MSWTQYVATQTGPETITATQAITWLTNNTAVEHAITEALAQELPRVWAEGYAIGYVSATTVVATPRGEIPVADWGAWEPGDTTATDLLLGPERDGAGLRELLAHGNITITSVATNRLNDLGKLLARAADQGLSGDQTAALIKTTLDNPTWAHLIAITELNRATSAATMATYRSMGLAQHEWLTAEDQRVCPVCDANEAAGPTNIGTPFPDGSLYPPAHPACRCALTPVISDFTEEPPA